MIHPILSLSSTIACAVALFAPSAVAASYGFQDCRSEIVTEVFTSCPGGEGGSGTVCGSQVTKWGDATATLTVDSVRKTAAATVVYTPVGGSAQRLATNCVLGDDNWISCTTRRSVPTLGRLSIEFNADGIAEGVYFTDIFADESNVPVGGFQTELDCRTTAPIN